MVCYFKQQRSRSIVSLISPSPCYRSGQKSVVAIVIYCISSSLLQIHKHRFSSCHNHSVITPIARNLQPVLSRVGILNRQLQPSQQIVMSVVQHQQQQSQPWASAQASSPSMTSPPASPSTPRFKKPTAAKHSASNSSSSNSGGHQTPSLSSSKLSSGLQKQKKSPSGSSAKASNLSHVPCKFFKQGSCQAGDSCPFSHAINASTADAPCKYFQKGNCKFGNKCALAHILPDGRRVNGKHHHPHGAGGHSHLKSSNNGSGGGSNSGNVNAHQNHSHHQNHGPSLNNQSRSHPEPSSLQGGTRSSSGSNMGPESYSHFSMPSSNMHFRGMPTPNNTDTLDYSGRPSINQSPQGGGNGLVPSTPRTFHGAGFGSPEHDSPSIFTESLQFTASISAFNGPNPTPRNLDRSSYHELSQSFDHRGAFSQRTNSFMESSPSLPPLVNLAPSAKLVGPRSMSASSTSLWKDRPFIRGLRTASHLFENTSAIDDDDESDAIPPSVGPLKQSRWANRLLNGSDFGFRYHREEVVFSDDESAIEEEFVPSSLKDLLTPQERERRDSRNYGNVTRHGKATFNDFPLFQPVGTPDKSPGTLVPAAIVERSAQADLANKSQESLEPLSHSTAASEDAEEHHDTQFVMDDLQEKA